jgi:membrane protease YdiL (CAAX protease family)
MSVSPAPTASDRSFAWWAPLGALVAAFCATIVFVVLLQGIGGLDGDGSDELSPAGTLAATFVQDLFLVVAAVIFAKLTIRHVTLATFGWTRFKFNKRLWLVPLLFLLFYGFLQVFGELVDPGAEDELPTDLGARDSTAALIGVAVLVGVVAPFVEEVFFRGFLFKAFATRMPWIVAALIAGSIFGLVHAGGTDAVFILPLALFGVVLCVLYQKIGSLLPGMALHALNNGLALGTVLDWSAQGTIASALGAPAIVLAIAWMVAPE